MWNVNNNGAANGKSCNGGERRQHGGPIAVGVSRVSGDKASQGALKWAIDHLVSASRDHVVVKLIHVAQRLPSPDSLPHCPSPTFDGHFVATIVIFLGNNALINEGQASDPIDEILLPFRCYCTRKGVSSEVVVLEDHDVAKALIEYISRHGIENFVLGSSSKNGFSKRLFKTSDIPSSVQKWAPDFCNVYTVSKGKIYSVRAARRRVPSLPAESNYICRAASSKSYDEVSVHEADMDIDLSFASSGRKSTDSMLYSFYENFGPAGMTRISSATSNTDINGLASELDFGNFDGLNTLHEMPQSMAQHSASGNPFLLQKVLEEMEDEMKRLRMELKQTIDMYHAACKEAVTAKQKATELEEWKMKEEQTLEEALLTLEATAAALENEKAKSKAAILAASSSEVFEEEVQKRLMLIRWRRARFGVL
ncbi:hypothetical protein M0R45_018860 [Rubus argutus]|uniref:RING-type E3 ubiquitin transferase n=1 Tax=Rubus argutus TaxID=59490 RepID=A0AAW1X6D2_RUBAR